MADYVVSSWDEFLQHNTSGDTVKFANPHEVDGEIVLSGTGTQADPYIVSTYEEMLFATGATYIWQVKLINRDRKLYQYRYIVDYAQPNEPIYADVFCIYDDSLSTIDFNDVQPEGYNSNLVISANVNGNGWTWKNIVLNNSEISFTGSAAPIQLIFSNLYSKLTSSSSVLFRVPSGINNSILDIFCESTASGASVFRGASSGVDCNSLSVNLKTRGSTIQFGTNSSSVYIKLKNTRLNLDVDAEGFYIGSSPSGYAYGTPLENVVVTGEIKTSSTDDVPLGRSITNCIFDVSYSGNGKLLVSSNSTVKTASFYNSDKVEDETGLAVTNMIGATTADLKSAQYLYDNDLPIGVDDL